MNLGGLKIWLGIASTISWDTRETKWLEKSGCLYWLEERLATIPKQHWWWVWWLFDCCVLSTFTSAWVWQSCWTTCWECDCPSPSLDAGMLPAWMRLANKLRQRAIQIFLILWFYACLSHLSFKRTLDDTGIHSKNGETGLSIPTLRFETLKRVQTLALGGRTISYF